MKKCPFCAEEIQPEAKFCRWCQKDLTVPAFSPREVLRRASFLLLLVAAVTFFLPFVRFQFPMMGTQSFSAAGVVAQLVRAEDSVSLKKEDGRFTMDVRSLQKMMKTEDGAAVFRSRPVYLLIPIGLACGALAYVSLIFIAAGLWRRKARVAGMIAAGGFFLVLPFGASLLLLDDLLQTTINSSIGALRDNPFADLAAAFMQGIRIEPAGGLYVLGATVLLIAVINGQGFFRRG